MKANSLRARPSGERFQGAFVFFEDPSRGGGGILAFVFWREVVYDGVKIQAKRGSLKGVN